MPPLILDGMNRASRIFFSGVAALLVLGTAAFAGPRPVVVELFTSQGCADCPPADAFLGKLAQRPNILAITLPVTYWDMLGWKDTLARDENTRRQKAYAQAMGRGGVYTPQIIVDGVSDVVGSRIASVEAAIAAREDAINEFFPPAAVVVASREAGASVPAENPPLAGKPQQLDPVVPIMVRETPDEMHITIGAAGGTQNANATVWMFHLRSQVTVAISRGENTGHILTYRNVAGDVKAIGVWKGRTLSLTLPRSAMAGLPHDGVAIVVQQGGFGHIIGAAYLARPDFYAQR
jgi:hypothetical protein